MNGVLVRLMRDVSMRKEMLIYLIMCLLNNILIIINIPYLHWVEYTPLHLHMPPDEDEMADFATSYNHMTSHGMTSHDTWYAHMNFMI